MVSGNIYLIDYHFNYRSVVNESCNDNKLQVIQLGDAA